jgi:hypothetical protein
MPTVHPRLNITLEPATADILADLARREKRSVSSVAKDLILDALDRHEDRALSRLAESRDRKGVKTVGHDDAWK